MADLIRALTLWARLVFGARSSGLHRARTAPPVQPALVPTPVRPPAPRSPYGLDVPLDGDESALVRPYLVAYDQRQERARQRRLALVLAVDFGFDLDTRDLHGLEVA